MYQKLPKTLAFLMICPRDLERGKGGRHGPSVGVSVIWGVPIVIFQEFLYHVESFLRRPDHAIPQRGGGFFLI